MKQLILVNQKFVLTPFQAHLLKRLLLIFSIVFPHHKCGKLWASHHNGVTSLSNTNKAITSRGSAIQYHPISRSSAHTHAITSRTLRARYNAATSSSNTNEETIQKYGERQHSIILTSLPNTNEATNFGGSELHFPPISNLPTQINRIFPRGPNEIGQVSSIIN